MQANALETPEDYHESDKPRTYEISFLSEPALSLIFSNETVNSLRGVSSDMRDYSGLRDASPKTLQIVLNEVVTAEGLEKIRLRSKFNNLLFWVPAKQDNYAWHNGLQIKLATKSPLLYFPSHELGPNESMDGSNAIQVISDARFMLPDVLFDKGSKAIGTDSGIQALIVQPQSLRNLGDRKPNKFRFIVVPIFNNSDKQVITGFVGLW
jgi:hypothetical protein